MASLGGLGRLTPAEYTDLNDRRPEALPVSLLAEEYRLRHLHADKPDIGEYQRRFGAQFESLLKHLGPRGPGSAPPTPASPANVGTVGPESAPAGDNTPDWG